MKNPSSIVAESAISIPALSVFGTDFVIRKFVSFKRRRSHFGLFSYGSGAVSEFFSGRLVAGYENQLKQRSPTPQLLISDKKLSIEKYEAIFTDSLKSIKMPLFLMIFLIVFEKLKKYDPVIIKKAKPI